MDYSKFKEIVSGKMCKGSRAEYQDRPHHQHLENLRPDILLAACLIAAGIDPKLPRAVEDNDTSDDYARALRESDYWTEIIPEAGVDFYPLLREFDLLTWAHSQDGSEGCNSLPGLSGGNTTIGFLLEAAGEFPTVWLPPDVNTPAGIYPLAELLEREKVKGAGHLARLIYIHRRVDP